MKIMESTVKRVLLLFVFVVIAFFGGMFLQLRIDNNDHQVEASKDVHFAIGGAISRESFQRSDLFTITRDGPIFYIDFAKDVEVRRGHSSKGADPELSILPLSPPDDWRPGLGAIELGWPDSDRASLRRAAYYAEELVPELSSVLDSVPIRPMSPVQANQLQLDGVFLVQGGMIAINPDVLANEYQACTVIAHELGHAFCLPNSKAALAQDELRQTSLDTAIISRMVLEVVYAKNWTDGERSQLLSILLQIQIGNVQQWHEYQAGQDALTLISSVDSLQDIAKGNLAVEAELLAIKADMQDLLDKSQVLVRPRLFQLAELRKASSLWERFRKIVETEDIIASRKPELLTLSRGVLLRHETLLGLIQDRVGRRARAMEVRAKPIPN